jgi:hypothetical protein
MKKLHALTKLLLILALPIGYSGCVSSVSPPLAETHALVGGWKATDDTIFVFRNNGTFHGLDWHDREIWGNWVSLAPNRIGFQSLTHDSFYNPQYAVISEDKNIMNYIVTGGTRFIEAERIAIDEAETIIDKQLEGRVILPENEK